MNSNFGNEIKDIDVVEKVEIIEEIQDGIKIFRLKGRLDSNTSPVLEDKLFQAISDGSKKIIVDFENLDYTSSAGLRVVFNASNVVGGIVTITLAVTGAVIQKMIKTKKEN